MQPDAGVTGKVRYEQILFDMATLRPSSGFDN